MTRLAIYGMGLAVLAGTAAAQGTGALISEQASHCVVVSEGAPPLPAKLLSGQGKISFPITTRHAEAQAFFEQGVAQMHSFWAREAERSFLQAAQLDPSAAMQWWGVAMVAAGDFRPHFQLVRDRNLPGTLPSTPNEKRALAAARRARELAAAPGRATDKEKMYIDAVWARRNPEGKKPDEEYTAGLRRIVENYPNEVEAWSYLALHLMDGFEMPAKTPRPGSMEAVEILRRLTKAAPEHPGVQHYVIHGWEGSQFARDAWASCEKYPALVPEIPHALHMPGHIYAQTGKLEEATRAFVAAAASERGYMAADAEYGNQHHGHNVHFLAVVRAAAGDWNGARRAAAELLGYRETDKEQKTPDAYRTAYRQGWFAMVRSLVWLEKWDEILGGELIPDRETPREKFWRHWARGLALTARKDGAGARAELGRMVEVEKEFAAKVGKAAPREFRVGMEDLQGHIHLAESNTARGLEVLESASADERALRYNEPPIYPRPIAEAWGLAAQRAGQTRVAERAFRIALEQTPDSRIPREGLRGLGQTLGVPSSAGR
jgi:tetratricopeptide (TPR) repeat protein